MSTACSDKMQIVGKATRQAKTHYVRREASKPATGVSPHLLGCFRIELQHRPGLLLEHRVQGREEPVKALNGVLLAGVRIA